MSNETERNDGDTLSELFKGSPRPIEDLMSECDPEQAAIQTLYEQAVKAAQKGDWPVPEREEFEARYKGEMSGKIPQ